MEFKNYMEVIVEEKLDEILSQYPRCCKCDSCRMDIAVLALNNLKPKYVSTAKGQIFARIEGMNSQYEVEVIRQIAAAIEKVEAHPRHEPKL